MLAGENLSSQFSSSTCSCSSIKLFFSSSCPLVLPALTCASMSKPLTIDLTKADSLSDSDDDARSMAMIDRGSSSDSCIIISDDGTR